ncbi:MAG: penicillin acylase family protein [Nannocystaceae bacterium]
MQLPLFNVGYADRDGHILFVSAGRIPERPAEPRAWMLPIPGDVASTLWDRILPYDALRTMQRSDRFELADHVLADLLAAAEASRRAPVIRAATVLARWDRRASSPGAVLFEAWADRIDWDTAFGVPWSPADPLATPRGLVDRERAVVELEAAAVDIEQRFGKLDVGWGEVRKLGPGRTCVDRRGRERRREHPRRAPPARVAVDVIGRRSALSPARRGSTAAQRSPRSPSADQRHA